MIKSSVFMFTTAWKRKRILILLCFLLAISGVLINVTGLFIAPVILGQIETASSLGGLIATIFFFTAVLMLVHGAESFLNNFIHGKKVFFPFCVLDMVHDKFMKTSYPNTEDQSFNNLTNKTMSTLGMGAAADAGLFQYWSSVTDLIKNTIGFVIYLTLLTNLEPFIIAVVIISSAAGFFITNHINGWGYRHREEEAGYVRRMDYIGNKAGDYTLAKDIRVFNMRGWLEDIFNSAFGLYNAFIARRERAYITANIAEVFITLIRNGAAYFVLLRMVINEGLSAPEFLLYFSAVGGFTVWISGILNTVSALHRQCLNISILHEVLNYPEPFKFEDGEPLTPEVGNRYEIELRGVSFRYAGAEADTLRDINLKIKAGEKLAVVGLNGAGKTTLVKLICGYYDPTAGEVLFNGENIKKYNRRDYYLHFSAVFQDFKMLEESISLNIAQRDAGIDMEKVKMSAERAGIDKKINSLPKGYETHLGKAIYDDGTELSSGERQRLMLARALYKNAPIIILDEPTAALDPIAESEMYNRYNELTAGRTSVYISHRLASTSFCDRIILIDENKIAEEGTHSELIKAGKKYAELFEIQSRYYKSGGAE